MRRALLTATSLPPALFGSTVIDSTGSPQSTFGLGIVLMATNPAPRAGTITSLNFYAFAGHTGTFYPVTGTFTSPDQLAIKSVGSILTASTAGAVNAYTGLSQPVANGDYFGVYLPTSTGAWVAQNSASGDVYFGALTGSVPTTSSTYTVSFISGAGLSVNATLV